MNKNTTAQILTGLILALAAGGAMAQQTALQQLGAAAGDDTVAIAQEFKTVRAMDAVPSPVVGLPEHAKDVFSSCDAIDAKAFMPWNVEQAAIIVQTCLNHAYASDGGYHVEAHAARFGARACPEGPRTCKAVMEVVGIQITVTGRIMTGESVLFDLNSSLEQRGNMLMGFQAAIDNQANILN
ncbi:MAG TPA: hypothetical protein VH309_10485 [Elusimicrobiota bacterium]|jgi:hypothetical protein|nr:hypothetical protein [Elusimicrobiota bacterium]